MNEHSPTTFAPLLCGVGIAAVIVGGAWGVWWRSRHWDDGYFAVRRLGEEIRLSYGMGPGPLTVMVFGFAAFVASVALLAATTRSFAAPPSSGAAAAFVFILLVTTAAGLAIRARRAGGKDDIVIDLRRRLLLIPAYSRPDARSMNVALDSIEALCVEAIDLHRGIFGANIDNRVLARLRGSSPLVLVAASLTRPAAVGMAAELGRLLNEAHVVPIVLVESESTRARTSQKRQ
jgi:hypothetical protein